MGSDHKIWVVNGLVHAICRAYGQTWVYIQRPEHFEKCGLCKVYSDVEEFVEEQVVLQLARKIDGIVECGVNCRKCKYGDRVGAHAWAPYRLYSLQKGTIPPPIGMKGPHSRRQ